MAKALIIETQNGVKIDGTDKWLTLNAADAVIDQIKTSESNKQASVEEFNTLVSGVPSPWARVKLTSYALSDNSDKGDQRTLIECYRHMRSEWRGLIAAYVLFSDRFVVSQPVALAEKSIESTYGRFDVRSVLGSMLFGDATLWKHTAEGGKNENAAPKIQLLYYHDRNYPTNQLVGGTSPHTLFFAATNYSLKSSKSDIYWIDDDGKFTDLTGENYRSRFGDAQCKSNIKKIVSFLKNINSNRQAYSNALIGIGGEAVREQVLNIESQIGIFIDSWLRDIAQIDAGLVEVDKNTMPVVINGAAMPAGPLYTLLETNYTYYWYDNTFHLSEQNGAVKIESASDLFIASNYLLSFKCSENLVDRFENAPVTYVKAKDSANGTTYFCALPFSRFALEKCFKDEVKNIIEKPDNKVKLDASVRSNMLKFVLRGKFSDEGEYVDILSKEFAIVEPDSVGHVFTWPNFASKIWNKYYFYSEYPTNGSGIRVMPVFRSLDEERCIDFDNAQINHLDESMSDMYLVKYPVGKVDSTAHRYEVLRSPYPVSLLSVKVDRDEKECPAGYLMIKTKSDAPSCDSAMRIINTEADNLSRAAVGIDFGSTNTCAYYRSRNEDNSHAVPFANRRLALIGFDNEARNLAQKHELYFISNEEPINRNGQVKSWLHEHNPLYIETAKAANELVGGVPVNETNIAVKAISENEITTNAGTLCSNMKWLSDKKGRDCKNSFMTTIWMQICADLFDKGACPETLYWSYPSAMSRRDINEMQKIYKGLQDIPVEGLRLRSIKSHTESEAVCSYAMTKDTALTDKRLFLGIDIGGSTSDVLIMGRKNGAIRLFSQCSLRMAANHFFKAINSSERFRKALFKFHESKVTKVKVINIEDIVSSSPDVYSRSPYYLNNIFDQLSGNEFYKFYNSLNQSVPFVFALPAYVTGILVFYSGLLVRNAIRVNNLEGIESVNMRYYGKGGRTFEWIYSVCEDEARAYYGECFRAGFGDKIRFVCDNVDELMSGSTQENKSEVARGLVNLKGDIQGIYESSDDDYATTNTPVEFLSEVFGESGFSYDASGVCKPIGELDIVDGEFYRSLHNPETFENFFKFIDIYGKFLANTGIAEIDLVKELKTKRTKVDNVMQFFDNDKEYKKYQEEKNGADESTMPSYRMPVFIAEALYYLDKVLLPSVFKA